MVQETIIERHSDISIDREDFFNCLYNDTTHDIELRAIPSKKTLFTRNIKDINSFCLEYIHDDLYFGVGTREGKRGKKQNVRETPALYIDIDFKDNSESELEILEKLLLFAPKPSIIIHSGGGLHVYWVLNVPYSPAIEVEPYLKGLCHSLGGDPKAAECSRILRIPETTNHKYPTNVTIHEFTPDLRYDISEFAIYRQNLPVTYKIDKKYNSSDISSNPQIMKPCFTKMLATNFDKTKHISRNEVSVAITSELKRLGYEDEKIIKRVLRWNENNIKNIKREKLLENVNYTLNKDYNYSCFQPLLKIFCQFELQSNCEYYAYKGKKKYFNNRPFLQYGWQNILSNASKDIYYIALPELERRKGVGAGGRIYANQNEIAKCAGISTKNMRTHLKELALHKLIVFEIGTPRVWEGKATMIQRLLPIPKPPMKGKKVDTRTGKR